jgi:hypothetical protein
LVPEIGFIAFQVVLSRSQIGSDLVYIGLSSLNRNALVSGIRLPCRYRGTSAFRLQRKLRRVDFDQRLSFLYRVAFVHVYLFNPPADLSGYVVDLDRHDLAGGLDLGFDSGPPLDFTRLDGLAIIPADGP